MIEQNHFRLNEAFNSMLRTDYISLNDVEKLRLLSEYYVDYFGLVPDVLSDTDQLIVGRRGTGKTTLLYRAFVGCMESWATDYEQTDGPRPRTLGIYVDLSKCQLIDDVADSDFTAFEHAFVSEVCEAISDQLTRFWPALSEQPTFFARLFRAAETSQAADVREVLERIGAMLREGIPRLVDRTGPVQQKTSASVARTDNEEVGIALSPTEAGATAKRGAGQQETQAWERTYTERTTYRLSVADILRILAELREKANLPATYLFVDEFSALSTELQRRFSTLLKKLLGSHAGVFVKLSAITDKYTLGSSIILQRDLFELSLDLDAFVERSRTLNDAMDGLKEFAAEIVQSRLAAYSCPADSDVFEDPSETYSLISRAAMGVPRTLGIVLKQALSRARQARAAEVRKSDISHGIRYASSAYLSQLLGAARDGVAIPAFHADMWNALVTRAQQERSKVSDAGASHFMVLARNEQMLSVLNMFFLVHLLTKSRTTKKDRSTRSLYCFDFGICEDNNLGYTTDKNVIRQQRFAYDDVLSRFEPHFGITTEAMFRCPACGTMYVDSDLMVAGSRLTFCPRDKADLVAIANENAAPQYTEEETKIIGSIRSATRDDHVIARQIADDVGCYIQKVAKFGEKLERDGLVARERDEDQGKLIYFAADDEDG
jgi:hypothetical protein